MLVAHSFETTKVVKKNVITEGCLLNFLEDIYTCLGKVLRRPVVRKSQKSFRTSFKKLYFEFNGVKS